MPDGLAAAVMAGLAAGIGLVVLFSIGLGPPFQPQDEIRSSLPKAMYEAGLCKTHDGGRVTIALQEAIQLQRGETKVVTLCLRSTDVVQTTWQLTVSGGDVLAQNGIHVQFENNTVHFQAYTGKFAGREVHSVPSAMGEFATVKMTLRADDDAKLGLSESMLMSANNRGEGIGGHFAVNVR